MKILRDDHGLGTLQRWVRECDFALQQPSADPKLCDGEAEEGIHYRRNISLLLLDAVMRVANLKNTARVTDTSVVHALPSTVVIHHYQMTYESSCVMKIRSPSSRSFPKCDIADSAYRTEKVRVLSHVPGAQRRPPSETDLNIFSISPRTITFERMESSARRLDVPGVFNTFLMQNVLSSDECNQLIYIAETIGYSHDAVEGIDNIVLYADDSLLSPIFERCRHLLPQEGLMGINSRFRFFRYRKGAVYRPHIGKVW